MFVVMRLRWERARRGVYRGFADGHARQQLAQVVQITGPTGRDSEWLVWLVGHPDVLDARPPTMEDAIRLAEAELEASAAQTETRRKEQDG